MAEPQKGLETIRITVIYRDEEGSMKANNKDSKTFESAQEDLGKLQRFLEKIHGIQSS